MPKYNFTPDLITAVKKLQDQVAALTQTNQMPLSSVTLANGQTASMQQVAEASFTAGGSDGIPPQSAPVVVVFGGAGSLHVVLTPISNPDPVEYAYHISTISGFFPSDATLAHRGAEASYTITSMPNGTDLDSDLTYFIKVIPYDGDGPGPTSTQVSGSPGLGLIEPGTILQWTGSNIPGGYLATDGSAVSRLLYPDLAALYWDGANYRWGNGNGTTTFNLPNVPATSAVVTSTSVLTALTGFSVTAQNWVRIGRTVMYNITMTRTGATISVGTSGDWTNTNIASIDAAWNPSLNTGGQSGTQGPMRLYILGSNNTLTLVSGGPSDSLATGDSFNVNGTYIAGADVTPNIVNIVKY